MLYRVADFEIEPDAYRVTAGGRTVSVEPQVVDVLTHLIAHRDHVVSKNELLDEVWGDRFVSESAITSRIKTARQVLGDDGSRQHMIRTVRGRGYQFVGDVEEVDSPVDRGRPSGSFGRASIPIPPTPLIGRDHELQEIAELLTTARVVTVLGPGGVGKTRLAIEAATRAQELFPDGVVFVELDQVGEAAEVAPTIAARLNIPVEALGMDRSGTSPLRELRLLLVLDNFEHVLAAASDISSLVATTEQLVVLTTSRERLRLLAESSVDIEPFGTQPDDLDAIRLFERTVKRVGAGRTGIDRSVAIDICRAVDGLPLAIELAAAATRTVPPEVLLGRLHDNLGVLASDAHDRPDRHRTMVAAISSSVDGLSESERLLLAHLSLFSAPIPLRALAVVSGRPTEAVLADLADLVDKSLVRPFDGPGEDAWFTVLRLIREYAGGLLADAGIEADARLRHAEEVADTLTELEELRWSTDAPVWIAVVTLRYGDAASAYRWARSCGRLDLAARIAAPLYSFWHRVGHHDQGWPWITESLAHVGGETTVTAAMLHLGAGYIAWAGSDLAAAGSHWEQALAMWRTLGRQRYESFCLALLAGLSIDVPDQYDDAITMNAEAIAIARRIGEPALLVQALNITGELARVQGERGVAAAAYREALQGARVAGDHQFEAIVTSNLAALESLEGHHEQALELGRAALRLSADRGQWMTAGFCVTQLGCAEQRRDRPVRAARLLGVADEILRRQAATRHVADRPDYRRAVDALQVELGGQTVRDLMADGAAMSFGEAVTYALGTDD